MRSESLTSGQYAPVSQYNALKQDAYGASQLLPHAGLGKFALPTNPSNTQTLTMTINGTAVVFTFVSSIGAVAGNVLIGATAAATAANLQTLFDAPNITTSTGVALSGANQTLVSYVDMLLVTTNAFMFTSNVPSSNGMTTFTGATTATGGSFTADTLAMIVEPGNYWIGGTRIVFTGGQSPDFVNPTTNPRIDLLVINSSGTLSIVQGAENVSPSVPAYPKDKLVLCEVFNRHGETKILDFDDSTNGYMQNDVRPFLNNGKYISQTATEIFVASDTGSASAYVIATNPSFAALTDGMILAFRAANASTGASTLNVNSIGASAIKKAGNVALNNADIGAGQIVIVEWDATNSWWQMQSQSGIVPTSFISSGQDGAVVFSGGTTLTRDMYYTNVTINVGVTVNTGGYIIFWTGTFTNNGSLVNNGGTGGNGTAGTLGNPSIFGPGGSGGGGAAGGTLVAGTAGVAGGNGASSSGFNANGLSGGTGTAGTAVTNSLCTNTGATGATGGNGGSGGGFSGGSGGGGGAGGACTQATMGPYNISQLVAFSSISQGAFTTYKPSPSGGGGGGGASGGSGANGSGSEVSVGGGGGGSGGSGGTILLIGNILVNSGTGTIQAAGGTGGNGGTGSGGSSGGGAMNGAGGGAGGTGGNGGLVVIAAFTYTNSGTVNAPGGSGGTGAGGGSGSGTGATSGTSGANGTTGNAGTVISITL